jgi:hypothetical protein
MPFAVDDADGDLAFPFAERVVAGVEMRAERGRSLRQPGIVHPDLARSTNLAADLFYKAIALLLLWSHLLVGNLGITAKGGGLGHFSVPSEGGLAGIRLIADLLRWLRPHRHDYRYLQSSPWWMAPVYWAAAASGGSRVFMNSIR